MVGLSTHHVTETILWAADLPGCPFLGGTRGRIIVSPGLDAAEPACDLAILPCCVRARPWPDRGSCPDSPAASEAVN